MNAQKKTPRPGTENLLPASLADQRLDHLERMIRTIVKNSPAGTVHGMDPDYWQSRIQALVDESNLLVVQQQRVRRLLTELQKRAKSITMDRSAA